MASPRERLRFGIRDELWPLNFAAAAMGVALALVVLLLSHHRFLGTAWVTDVNGARAAIGAIFGVQATVISVGLSLSMLVLQNAAGQHSPRLVGVLVREPQIRWGIPVFVFSGAFDLIAVWALGFRVDREPGPQPVLGIAYILLFVVGWVLVFQILGTIRAIRIEAILVRVVEMAEDAAWRLLHRRDRLGPVGEGGWGGWGSGAQPIRSPDTGYVADIDLQRLVKVAARLGVRVQVEKGIGSWVDPMEPLGWYEADVGAAAEGGRELGDCFMIRPEREVRYDVGFLLQILAEVGIKALSPGINDPQTARMALQHMREILSRLPDVGESWLLSDPSGHARVHVPMLDPGPLLSLAVDGILRYGAGDPEVLQEIVVLLQALGTSGRGYEDLTSRALVRVGQDAAARLDSGRASEIQAAIARAQAAIEAQRHPPQPAGAFLYAVEGA